MTTTRLICSIGAACVLGFAALGCDSPERKQPVVLNEAKPWACIRCSKPFGTQKAIEAMLGKLAGHAMFQGEALERLKMCSDCRVIDLYSAQNEMKITQL